MSNFGHNKFPSMLNRSDLESWAALGESEIQEFKATTGQRTEAAKTICAMLNNKGGRVIFGVDASGKVTGQTVSDKTLEDVAHELGLIEPPILPTIERIPIGGAAEAILVGVDRGTLPHTFKGKAYRRIGTTNAELSREEYNRLLLERLHSSSRWENQFAEGWTLKDLDDVEIVRTIEEAIRRGRSDDPGTRNPADILRGLGLLKDERLLRAAVVLFARSERLLPDFPQCLLRLARFKGTDKTEFIDNRQYHGNAFDLLLRGERFFRDHLPIAGRIVPTLFEREDDPLYPPLALREALANALCHRDYSIGGGSVGVAIFDDRLEISSSGILHFGLTIEDLYKPHESRPWNPMIASVFFRRGVIETWGRGTLKMAELTDRAGLPRPEIEERTGSIIVRFRPSRYLPPQRIAHNLSERQQEILRLMGSLGAVPIREINQVTESKIGLRAIREELGLLKKLHLVDSKGKGRGAVWFLKGQKK